jgi:hypothetical protein
MAGDRDVALALVSQVEGMIKQGSYDKAADMCRRALAADDTCGEAHYQLGVCQAQLNQPREATQSYQKAVSFGLAAKDDNLVQKARGSLKKLCPAVFEFEQADQRLADRLLSLADEALAAGQLETACEAFDVALAANPALSRAKEGSKKAHAQLELRGDPVLSKLADAMLQEVWYLVGVDRKDEAKKMAAELSQRYAQTPSGREATQLVANDFGPPKKEEALALKKQLVEQQKAAAKVAATKPPPPPPTTTTTTVAAPAPKPKPVVDLDALEAAAAKAAKESPKEGLGAAFDQALKQGKEFYSKAAPGTEGNQANVLKALEQFIRCEAFFTRMEDEKLATQASMKGLQEASMLRYGCQKMIVLSQ